MAEIIILANSRKADPHRCIAGIDRETGKWVRPVSSFPSGPITWKMRAVGGAEPELLDVIRIPLDDAPGDSGFQPENRRVLPGRWLRVGRVRPEDVMQYCESTSPLFFNKWDNVGWREIQKVPPTQLKSLQLIHCQRVKCYTHIDRKGTPKVRAAFRHGANKHDLAVTDPVAEGLVETHLPTKAQRGGPWNREAPCLLTIGLAERFRGFHYKVVAGVIAL